MARLELVLRSIRKLQHVVNTRCDFLAKLVQHAIDDMSYFFTTSWNGIRYWDDDSDDDGIMERGAKRRGLPRGANT